MVASKIQPLFHYFYSHIPSLSGPKQSSLNNLNCTSKYCSTLGYAPLTIFGMIFILFFWSKSSFEGNIARFLKCCGSFGWRSKFRIGVSSIASWKIWFIHHYHELTAGCDQLFTLFYIFSEDCDPSLPARFCHNVCLHCW